MAQDQQWPKKVQDVKFMRALGRGFFGEVWECKMTRDPEAPSIALKKVPLRLVQQHNLTEQMDREIEILRKLRHPRIVELWFDFRDTAHVYLGMPFAQGGGMFDALSKQKRFTCEKSAQHMYDLCDALDYLHTLPEPVIHRDIKPENVLMDKDGRALLADFGWSNMIGDNKDLRMTFCGTPDYLAPEMIRGKGHNTSLDMWCMGVLLYEMLIGRSPFGAANNNQEATMRAILARDLRFPSWLDKDAQDLIDNLCKIDPQKRLTATQAKTHTFEKKYYAEAAAAAEASAVDAVDTNDPTLFCGRPSVSFRKFQSMKKTLDTEFKQALQAKTDQEAIMMDTSDKFEDASQKLVRARAERTSAEQKREALSQQEAEKRRELEECLRQIEELKSAQG
jgi:serine/threonine protein kinase